MIRWRWGIWAPLVFLCLIVSCSAAFATETTVQSGDDLVGSVQTVLEKRLVLSYDGQVTASEAISETQFTVAGLPARVAWYKNYQIYREKSNLYDSHNRLIASGTYGRDGVFQPARTYNYNDSGYLQEIQLLKPDGSVFVKKVNRYNGEQLLTEQMVFDSANKPDGGYVFLYQPDGRLAAQHRYDGKGQLLSRISYHYDSQSNAWQERVYEGSDSNKPVKEIIYNEMGKKAREINYGSGGDKVREFVCEYNEAGKKVRQSHYQGDGTKYTETFFNDDGLPIRFIHYQADGSERYEEYQYQYDQRGNWIEKAVISSASGKNPMTGSSREIIQRTITYY